MGRDHRRVRLVWRLVLQATASLLCAGLLGMLGAAGIGVRMGYGAAANVPFIVAGAAGAVGGVLVAIGLLWAAAGVVRTPADPGPATHGLSLSRIGRWVAGVAAGSTAVLAVVMSGLQDEDRELLAEMGIGLALVLAALVAAAAKADAWNGDTARYLSRLAGTQR